MKWHLSLASFRSMLVRVILPRTRERAGLGMKCGTGVSAGDGRAVAPGCASNESIACERASPGMVVNHATRPCASGSGSTPRFRPSRPGRRTKHADHGPALLGIVGVGSEADAVAGPARVSKTVIAVDPLPSNVRHAHELRFTGVTQICELNLL